MRNTDIAIVGGGLAGSTAAAMLARAGYDVVLVDPHSVYPPDLRCEKIDGPQMQILRKTGLAEAVLRASTFDGECWIARFGRLVEKRRGDQYGILYDTLVNTVRAEIPAGAEFVHAKATAISTGPERQTVTLSNDEGFSARLVVLANGLNIGLRHALGMTREVVSAGHSVTIAFDLKPVGRRSFAFPALTYYGERTAHRVAYITLFPIGSSMRANFMVYRDMADPWLSEMRHRPEQAMKAVMPRFEKLVGSFEVVGPVKIRPADLYLSHDFLQHGIVLIGDAFATSCPAAGTGTSKVFTDVERLCNVHVPQWFETGGMGVEKIAAFYNDPVKRSCDAHSFAKAFHLRSLSVDEGPLWRAGRWSRFLGRYGIGLLQQAKARLTQRSIGRPAPIAGDGAGAGARVGTGRVDSPSLIPAQAGPQGYAGIASAVPVGPHRGDDERTVGGNAA
jgi:2-polyprenyl-6-methoxyphenol hydroxylase-like FAD-dependent oxidoreductase